MPILELNGFKAWITCKGRKVEQFSVDYDHDHNTVSCWIPGIVESEFIVHWRCTNPENASSGHVWVDGEVASSAIIRAGNYSPVKRTGAKLKDGRLRPFTFAKLNLTGMYDDRVANPRDPLLANIGTIEVSISWVKLGATTTFQGYETHAAGIVHEKSKKLGAIHTAYGEAITTAKTRAIITAPVDPENPGPHARFIFHYRTLEVLQAIGIVPRGSRDPGSADAAEEAEVIDIDDDSDEDELIPSPTTKPASQHMRSPSQDGGEKEEDEAAVGIKEKPLFLDDDATMQSGDEDVGPADMTAGLVPERRGRGGQGSQETNGRSRGDLRTRSKNFFADDDEEE